MSLSKKTSNVIIFQSENKYGYFKNAIESNIRKLNTNIENLWGEDEYNLWY